MRAPDASKASQGEVGRSLFLILCATGDEEEVRVQLLKNAERFYTL